MIQRSIRVYLLPELIRQGELRDGIAVVIDVLRATTTMTVALAAGCTQVLPCAEVDEARALAEKLRSQGERVLLGGERGGAPLPGFDLGNSPREYVPEVCQGKTLVLTTSNGTRALLRATEASRIIVGAFINLTAVVERLGEDERPLHLICAGTEGEITLEDTLLAGALIQRLEQVQELRLNDSARLALYSYDHHAADLLAGVQLGRGADSLRRLGYEEDIRSAVQTDLYRLVPELERELMRVVDGSSLILRNC